MSRSRCIRCAFALTTMTIATTLWPRSLPAQTNPSPPAMSKPDSGTTVHADVAPTEPQLRSDASKDAALAANGTEKQPAPGSPSKANGRLQESDVGASPANADATSNQSAQKADKKQSPPSTTLRSVLESARKARCKTAICFGEDDKWALEPLAELPIGSTFCPWTGRDHPLGSYINNHTYSASLTAGIRFWLFWDWVSIATYFSAPLASDDTIRIPGSSYEFPSNRVKRPYPGIAIGVFGDIVWLGGNIEELHNGDTDQTRDPTYPRNAVIDRELTVTIAFAPLAMIRDGIGIGTAKSEEPKTGAQQKEQ